MVSKVGSHEKKSIEEAMQLPDTSLSHLENKYKDLNFFVEADFDEMTAFIEENFNFVRVSPKDMSNLVFDIELENCKAMTDARVPGSFEFRSWFIKGYRKRTLAGRCRDFIKKQHINFDILMEKSTGYIRASDFDTDILLNLKRGISQEDFCKKNHKYYEFIALIDMIAWDYSEKEQKEMGIFEIMERYRTV